MGLSQGGINSNWTGTILPTGTLSSQIDTSGLSVLGLIIRNMTAGTLTAMVSDKPDAESGVFLDLKDNAGANVVLAHGSGAFAVSSVALEPLAAYRYVRIKASAGQTTGAEVVLVMKAHG